MAQHGRSIASIREARSCERQKLRGAYQYLCSFVQQTRYFADITLAGSSAPDIDCSWVSQQYKRDKERKE